MGDWKDDERIGKGVYYCANGDKFEGEFVDGKLNGKGIFYWAGGDRYEGDYVNDNKEGKGTYYYASGNKYVGDWKDNKRTGKGIYYFADGNRYEGDFLNNSFHGKGIFYWADGDRYEGDYANDKKEGKGTYYYADGNKYVGDWKDNERTGKGIFTWTNGNRYEGEFENGKRTKGTLYDKNGNEIKERNVKSEEKETTSFVPESTNGGITFADVAGLDDVKDQIIYRVLEPMKDPEFAAPFDVTPGGKILLYGPPGTGKTLIARAIAGEVDAVFYSISCEDLISKWLGESSERLNKLFEEAEKHEKAIIFFDEFDSVASKRTMGTDGASNEMARFVATFLTKVDGFKPKDKNKMLLLIAATNRPWALDSAMLRGGRFDTQIYVGTPDLKAREFLVNKSLGKLMLEEDVSLSALAEELEGYGGGDIVSICEKIKFEAYKKSVKLGKRQSVTLEDCRAAIDSVHNNISKEDIARFEAYRDGLMKL